MMPRRHIRNALGLLYVLMTTETLMATYFLNETSDFPNSLLGKDRLWPMGF